MDTYRRKYQFIAFGTIVLAIIVCAIALAVKPPSTVSDVTVVHLRTASALAVTVTTLGGASMLLGGLKSFKKKLRVAYTLLASGIILFGVALFQLPVIGFFDLWNSWWANSGALILPFVFATGLIYAGVRRFALLLDIQNTLTSFPFVICFAFLLAIVSFIAGHYLAAYRSVAGTDTYIATVAWSASYCTCAVFLMRSIVKRIGPFYQNAMQWLLIALIGLTVSGWHEYTINYFFGNPDWYVSHGLSFTPFIITGLLLLRAGYAFCLLRTQRDTSLALEGPTEQTRDIEDSDFMDAITYVASLASRPAEIDFLLDDLRLVTSNLEPNQALSPDEKRRLLNVYLKLELYLMYHDPLRNFKREEIRAKLTPAFRTVLEKESPAQTQAEQKPVPA